MDNFEAEFSWPSDDASDVILTGSFDNWSCSIHLPKGASGFAQRVRVPWDEKVPYKFIVDGRWVTRDDRPTEFDGAGNLNNVLLTPSKPTHSTIDHTLTSTVPQAFTEPMTSTTSPEASPPYSETLQQETSNVTENHGIIESDSTDMTGAVEDVVVPGKEFTLNVPGVTVETDEGSTLSATMDNATSPVSNVQETVTNVCGDTGSSSECVPSGDTINPTMRSNPTDNIQNESEQPSANSFPDISSTTAEVPENVQGSSAGSTPQIAPIVHIAILPVNDHTLNESAAPSLQGEGEVVVDDPPVSQLSDVATPVVELSTHSPMRLSKATSATQDIQDEEQDILIQDSKPTQEETLVTQDNGELLVGATPGPSDPDANGPTQAAGINPNPVETTDTSAANAELVIPQHEPPSLAPETRDVSAPTVSSAPSTPALGGDTKLKDTLFTPPTTTNSPTTPSSKLKKRRSLFVKVKDFFAIKDKRKK